MIDDLRCRETSCGCAAAISGGPRSSIPAARNLPAAALLTASSAIKRLIRRKVLGAGESHVGILLPPSVGAVLANTAFSVDRRIAVNLNYTLTSAVINACLAQCGIRHVLTSRECRSPFSSNSMPNWCTSRIFSRASKGPTSCGGRRWPTCSRRPSWSACWASLLRPDDLVTVMFTSGSTGDPKGVMLSTTTSARTSTASTGSFNCGRATSAGRAAVLSFVRLHGHRVDGADAGPKGVYHFSAVGSPADRRAMPQARLHDSNRHADLPAIVSAPLPARGFASLEMVVAGAEKMPPDLAAAFRRSSAPGRWKATGPRSCRPSWPATSGRLRGIRRRRQLVGKERHGGPAVHWRRSRDRISTAGEGLPRGRQRACSGSRPQRDAGVSERPESDGQGHAGRRGT